MSEIFLEKTENSLVTKTCESCGKDFSCGANAGKCWCFDVELKAQTVAELREDFKNCLCEDCLLNHKLAPIDTEIFGEKL